MNTVGILLAGGKSTRYGSPKAFAIQQGKHFYESVYDALQGACNHVIIVAREELRACFPANLHVITDRDDYKGNGPLAGIYSAMLEMPAERYMVLPCDMPYITADVCLRLRDALVPFSVCAVQADGQAHPLVSCWERSMLAPLATALENDQRSVMKLLRQVKTKWIDGHSLADDPMRVFRNVNSPEQLAANDNR